MNKKRHRAIKKAHDYLHLRNKTKPTKTMGEVAAMYKVSMNDIEEAKKRIVNE